MYRKPVTILNLKTNFTKKVVRFKSSVAIARQNLTKWHQMTMKFTQIGFKRLLKTLLIF